MSYNLKIHTDGGARGNPGPAAIGVVVVDSADSRKEYYERVGETTNNQAEYLAVIFALKKVKQLLGAKQAKEATLEISIDSELLYKQVRGEYKMMDEKLQPLFIQIWNLRQDFKEVNFKLVPREQNKEADALVNKALDADAQTML